MAKFLKSFVLIPMLVLYLFLNGRIFADENICPVSTITETVSYSEDWALKWAPNNPPETIGDGDHKDIHVTGGLAP